MMFALLSDPLAPGSISLLHRCKSRRESNSLGQFSTSLKRDCCLTCRDCSLSCLLKVGFVHASSMKQLFINSVD